MAFDWLENGLESLGILRGLGDFGDSMTGQPDRRIARQQARQIEDSFAQQRSQIPGVGNGLEQLQDWTYDPQMLGFDGAGPYGLQTQYDVQQIPQSQMLARNVANPVARSGKGDGVGESGGFRDVGTTIGGANADQRSVDAQIAALNGFQNIANQGGLTAIDRARIADERSQENQWLRGQREATLANMQARGLGGSGAELASMLQNQQSSANRNSLADLNVEALAQQRAMDALGMSGNLASGIRQQSFGEAAQRAAAQDAINAANVGYTNDMNRWGGDVRNQGVMYNANTSNQGQQINRQDDAGQLDYNNSLNQWTYGQGADLSSQERDYREGRRQESGERSKERSQGTQDMMSNFFRNLIGGGGV